MSGRIYEMPVAPVSGDADRVVVMADRFGSTAESIRSASRSLRALDDGGSSSDAVDAFMAKAALLASQMGRAEERYEAAADALAAYARVLSVAQEAARRALREYGAAVDDHEVNHRQAEKFSGEALLEADELSKQWLQDQERLHRTRSDDARRRVIALGRVVDDAHAEVAAAATVAISRIDGASGDGLRDSVFDDIGGAVGAAYEGFQTWMENNDGWISVVIDVASLAGIVLMGVAMLIPGVNIAAMLVAGLVLLLSTARATAGTGTWAEVAVALLSMAFIGSGALAGKGLSRSIGILRQSRTSQLIESGASPNLAKGYVSRMWSRSRPGILDNSLVRSLGDPFTAQVRRFIRPPRVAGVVDDPVILAEVTRKLTLMKGFQSSDISLAVGGRVHDRLLDEGRPASRISVGSAW